MSISTDHLLAILVHALTLKYYLQGSVCSVHHCEQEGGTDAGGLQHHQ
jgi:hypothetical protein